MSEVGGPAKEAFAALTAFYLEAARVDADVTALRLVAALKRRLVSECPAPRCCSTVLEECKISTDRAEAIAATYTVSVCVCVCVCVGTPGPYSYGLQ